MRRFLFATVVLCLTYLVGGGILAGLGLVDAVAYNGTLGVAGGIASVAGLLTFFQPRLTPDDLLGVDGNSLKRIGELTEELVARSTQVSAKRQEIASLEQQRKELELLVRRASAALFLESRIRITRERVTQIVKEHPELRPLLDDLADLQGRLTSLNGEIEADPNVDLLQEILAAARSEVRLADGLPEPYRSIMRFVTEVLTATASSRLWR